MCIEGKASSPSIRIFIKQMKDLNEAVQLFQAMVMYGAYLVSGFTEPLLFDDVLGTHHHVLSL